MVKFIFVRHGQSKANETGYLIGSLETPLSALGEKQAHAVCEYILKVYKVDAVYSSPLSRAYDTIKGVAKTLGLRISKEEDLREINVGVWEGLSYEMINRDYAKEHYAWATDTGLNSPPKGETMAEVQKRVISKLTEIAKKEDGKTVLIGTHAAVMRAVQCYVQKLPLSLMKHLPWVCNASVSEIDFDGENFYIYKFGYDGHLAGLKK
ncbi:MAG: histidine phosphatase family protein [Clostridia bacterium]|nr:histidine phosphatase family protein [Clostridia bacterium]